jgi:aconitate hydratase
MMDSNTLERIRVLYQGMADAHATAQKTLGKSALTLAEKIIFAHMKPELQSIPFTRGTSSLTLWPDRVAMQDATAQMAMLQFMQSGRKTVAVPSTAHCDHLIRAQSGVKEDLERAVSENAEVYNFLKTASAKYGIGFWEPGSGIIHQVVLEKYAFPGGLMIGTDSHTPNAGGLGMMACGVGGSDAAEVMAGLAWEVRAPKLVAVKLSGKLNGWTAPKDIILCVLGKMTTKGGTNKIVEYIGEGARSLSCTGKATITNMGAELGATTSLFGFDEAMATYLRASGRAELAELALQYAQQLAPDTEVEANPEQYYDEVIEIDLNTLEPYVVGPHSPDKARPISKMAEAVAQENYPETVSAALIGSCTNSSFEDLERVAHLARQAQAKGLKLKTKLLISPGSHQVLETIKRDGQLKTLTEVGGLVLANACGPCIGNWDRTDLPKGTANSIVSSFNRNFPGRNDGSAETLSFITSPDMVFMYALSGNLKFNPLTDTIEGQTLDAPVSPDVPANGFALCDIGYVAPAENAQQVDVAVAPTSERLQLLNPFSPWDKKDIESLPVLLKTQGQTTTDHISPAGLDWLPLRGHLEGISHNMLLGAVDASTCKKADPVKMTILGRERGVSHWALKAREYRDTVGGSVVVGDENYGEGSSREHAAMSPRFLGVKAVIVRSFARIHETNLKKQGVLPFTFAKAEDYAQVDKGDLLSITGLGGLTAGQAINAVITKPDGRQVTISLNHSMTAEQISWFQAGSAINAANAPSFSH